MSYYKVKVKRYTTRVQTYEVSVNTDCPEHAKEMAAEVLYAELGYEDHELAAGDSDELSVGMIEEDFEVDETSDPVLCENTEDLFIN